MFKYAGFGYWFPGMQKKITSLHQGLITLSDHNALLLALNLDYGLGKCFQRVNPSNPFPCHYCLANLY